MGRIEDLEIQGLPPHSIDVNKREAKIDEALGRYIRVEETSGGPFLFAGTLVLRSWLGTDNNPMAKNLAINLRKEIKSIIYEVMG